MMNFSRLGVTRNRTQFLASGLIATVALVCSFSLASQRTSHDRSAPIKNGGGESQVIAELQGGLTIGHSNHPMNLGYKVSPGDVWVIVGSREAGYLEYQLATDPEKVSVTQVPPEQANIKPENFVKMTGTRQGLAAITRVLSQILADQAPPIRKRPSPTPGTGSAGVKIDAFAIFEEASVVHLLTAQIGDEDEPQLEEIGFVAVGCTATLSNAAGGCTCSATNGTCKKWESGGIEYAKCTDAGGTTTCSGSGGACTCPQQ